jgi:hypothetical protein
MLILKLVALLAFLFIPGYLVISLFLGKKSGMSGGERLFLSAVLGCGLVALLAMVIGLAGRFGFSTLIPAWVILCAALLYFARRRITWIATVGWRQWAILALLAAVGLALFLPPGRVVFGWNDDGSYPNIAARMVNQGDIHTRVEVVQEVAAEQRDLVFVPNTDPHYTFQADLYKQYFITDYSSGEVVPQFYYLWPSLMAIFALFLGVSRMFYAVTLASLLSLWGVYLLGRRMLGGRWAWIAAILTVFSPLTLYFSKYTTSEMFTQAIFTAACLTMLAHLEEVSPRESVKQAVLSALLFTLCFLVRIDMFIVLPPLLLVFFWKRISSTWSRADTVFVLLILTGFCLATMVGRLASAPYFTTLFNYSFDTSGKLLIAVILAAFALIGVFSFVPHILRRPVAFLADRGRWWAVLTWIFLIGIFIFFYFIRPAIGDDGSTLNGIIGIVQGSTYDSQNLIRWGWYFSFPGLLLMFAGYGLAVTTEHRKSWPPVLAVGIFATLFYAWNMRCTPLQIMVMRRLVPMILPLAFLMIAYALQRIYGWSRLRVEAWPVRALWPLRKVVVAIVLLSLVVFSLSVAAPIFGLAEGGNQGETVAAVHAVTAEGTVLMDFNAGDLFGPPLLTFEDQPNAWLANNSVLSCERFPALLADLGFPEKPVYLLWRPSLSGSKVDIREGLAVKLVEEVVWREDNLETSFSHRPERRTTIDEPFEVYRIVPDD